MFCDACVAFVESMRLELGERGGARRLPALEVAAALRRPGRIVRERLEVGLDVGRRSVPPAGRSAFATPRGPTRARERARDLLLRSARTPCSSRRVAKSEARARRPSSSVVSVVPSSRSPSCPWTPSSPRWSSPWSSRPSSRSWRRSCRCHRNPRTQVRAPPGSRSRAASSLVVPCVVPSSSKKLRPYGPCGRPSTCSARERTTPPSRRAACAGTCRRGAPSRAGSPTTRRAPSRSPRASSGCTRRRRGATAPACRSPARPCRKGRRAVGRRRRRRAGRHCSRSSSSERPTSPAKKAAFVIPFSSAFSIAHATDSSDASTPHTVSAFRARTRPIVPVPQ